MLEQKLCALLPEHRKLDVSYTIDDENKLQHLFWCDFESQMNYQVFDDILAFDVHIRRTTIPVHLWCYPELIIIIR